MMYDRRFLAYKKDAVCFCRSIFMYVFRFCLCKKELPDFTKLVKANNKAVVNIIIGKRQSARSFGRPRGDERLESSLDFLDHLVLTDDLPIHRLDHWVVDLLSAKTALS